jgi:hypothetical protein
VRKATILCYDDHGCLANGTEDPEKVRNQQLPIPHFVINHHDLSSDFSINRCEQLI